MTATGDSVTVPLIVQAIHIRGDSAAAGTVDILDKPSGTILVRMQTLISSDHWYHFPFDLDFDDGVEITTNQPLQNVTFYLR